MKTGLITSDTYKNHDTGPGHPEQIARVAVIVENFERLNYNTIPEKIPQDLWRSCRTSNEIKSAIEFYRNRSDEEFIRHRKIGSKIKKDYFEPVTKESVFKFLMLEK